MPLALVWAQARLVKAVSGGFFVGSRHVADFYIYHGLLCKAAAGKAVHWRKP